MKKFNLLMALMMWYSHYRLPLVMMMKSKFPLPMVVI